MHGRDSNPRNGTHAEDTSPEDIFVVVPAYNEGPAIGPVVRELREQCYPVVVVDDGSGDETAEVAREAGAAVVRHPVNRGQGAALQTGLAWALRRGARYVVTFDADGQHAAADIRALVVPLADGRAQVALGSRFLGSTKNIPATRRLVLRLAVLFTRLSSAMRVTDTHNGLRAFTRAAAEQIEITLDRMAHASEILDQIHRRKLVYTEVPVHIRYTDYSREKGQSHAAAFRILADYLLGKLLG